MDDRPFPPAEPIHLADEQERLAATLRRMRRRRASRAGLGAATVAGVVAVAAPHIPGSPGRQVTAANPPATVAVPTSIPAHVPSTAIAPVPTTVPAIATTVPATTATAPIPNVTSGTVTGPDGQAVADAYIIGLGNLAVARTDAGGHYSLPCVAQKLVGATWLLPVNSPKPGSSGRWGYGTGTTDYGPPPTSAGAGYVFSGNTSDVSTATTVTCNGTPVDFRLSAGGAVDITWASSSPGSTTTTAVAGGASQNTDLPIDNLYLPGLGQQAALETAPVSPSGHQVIDRMGPGTLRIDGVSSPFTCTGPGVTGSGALWTVTVNTGQTEHMTCTTT